MVYYNLCIKEPIILEPADHLICLHLFRITADYQ